MKQKLWCCVRPDHNNKNWFDWSSLAYKRAGSIKKCVGDISYGWDWKKYKKHGWRCVKVEITLTEIK